MELTRRKLFGLILASPLARFMPESLKPIPPTPNYDLLLSQTLRDYSAKVRDIFFSASPFITLKNVSDGSRGEVIFEGIRAEEYDETWPR